MELCGISFRTILHSTSSPPRLSSFSATSFSLQNSSFKAKPNALNSLKLSSSTRQIQLSPLVSHRHNSFLPTVSASTSSSSSVTADTKIDRLPADLNVTETLEPNSRVKLQVEVPPLVCEDCYKMTIADFIKHTKVSGFQPGKVPESIVVNFIGKKKIEKATVESILRRTIPHAMSKVSRKALPDSMRIMNKFSELVDAYSSLGSLRYDVIVDVVPEIKWITENAYKNMKIVVEIDSEIDAHKASEQELRRRHKSTGPMKIVTERGLQIGDVIVLDISASTIDQDESKVKNIPSAESKGFHFDTDDGDKVLPGFVDSIIGIRPGETKSFPLVFPESWKQENLRGIHAQFTVTCKELFYRDLPDLDDSIADKLLPGCTTLEQVKEILLEKFLEVEQTAREQATDNAILDQLSKMVDVDIPQYLFEEQGRQLYGASLLEIQSKVKLTEEQLASLSSPKAVNEYFEHQRDNITRLIKQNLAVGDIYRRENFQLDTEDLVKEVENSIAEFKRQKQEYDEERVKDQVQEVLEGAKVLEWLKEHAAIQYITP